MDNQKAYLKITHPDPKEAKKMADTLLEFAKTIAKLTGEPEPTMEIVEPTTPEEL